MDWRALLHDRRVWLAGAVAAAGLGAVTFLRRRKAGAGYDTASPQGTGSGSIGAPAGFDSTGTDIAATLGQFGASFDRQFAEYGKTLTDSLSAIGQTTRPPGTPNPTGPGPAPRTVPQRVSVPLNTNIYDWLKQLNRGYGLTLDLNQLRALNPNIDQRILWGPVTAGGYRIPTFRPQTGPVAIR